MSKSTRLPIRDRSIYFIFSSETTEHRQPNQSEAMLGEFVRVLKPGGKVLLTTPDGLEYRRLLQESILTTMLLSTGRRRRGLVRRAQRRGRVVQRSLLRVFVRRGTEPGRRDLHALDRLETLVRKLRLDRFFSSCQMHLPLKPDRPGRVGLPDRALRAGLAFGACSRRP